MRELLGEIAADDTARLLRPTSYQAVAEASERMPFVRCGAPSLTKVERKLLECHREEVARILYRHSVLASMRLPGPARGQHFADGSPFPSAFALERRTRHLLSDRRLPADDVEMLGMCLGDESPSPLTILAAAARLAPSQAIRIAQGSNLLHVERNSSLAGEVLAAAVEQGGSHGSYALEGLGAVAADRGDWEGAASCYKRAVRADPDRRMTKLAWLRFSHRSRVIRDIEEAAQLVDSTLTVSDAAVRWYLGRPDSAWTMPSNRGPVEVAGLPDERFGTISRAVIHAS